MTVAVVSMTVAVVSMTVAVVSMTVADRGGRVELLQLLLVEVRHPERVDLLLAVKTLHHLPRRLQFAQRLPTLGQRHQDRLDVLNVKVGEHCKVIRAPLQHPANVAESVVSQHW